MYKAALISSSLSLVFVSPAWAGAAQADRWVVTQLSGDARVVHPGLEPASLKLNSQIAPGDTLLTGPTGRATLVHGGDYILVAPRSELRLPSGAQPSGFTRVIENLGTMLFKVKHTGIPHFSVDTPMLAAVVKGTTFTVVVEQHRSAVQVIRGHRPGQRSCRRDEQTRRGRPNGVRRSRQSEAVARRRSADSGFLLFRYGQSSGCLHAKSFDIDWAAHRRSSPRRSDFCPSNGRAVLGNPGDGRNRRARQFGQRQQRRGEW